MATTKGLAITAVYTVALSLSLLVAAPRVNATAGPKGQRKVVICHATNSHQNPYTINKVDKSSIDEVNNKYLNGHGDHKGGIWVEGVADHSWGDIIPAFTNDAGNSYPGQNWTTEGQAIYNNDCNIVPETPVQPETPGGNGNGNVLGTNTGGKGGVLAETGIPAFVNFLFGTTLLSLIAYVVRRGRSVVSN